MLAGIISRLLAWLTASRPAIRELEPDPREPNVRRFHVDALTIDQVLEMPLPKLYAESPQGMLTMKKISPIAQGCWEVECTYTGKDAIHGTT